MKWVVRIVGTLVALLVLSVLGLFIASNRRDAGRLRGNVEIDRPLETVWAWLSEPDKLTQWVGWLEAIEPDTTTVAEGIGHREWWVMNDPHMQGKLRIPGEITVWDPPNRIGVHIAMPGMMTGDVLYSLTALPNGRTRFEQDGRFRYENKFAALMEPLVTPDAMKKLVDDMRRLKQKVEAEEFPADSLEAEEEMAPDTTVAN
ncbi:MAG: SRPBCC family protein [Candidatus Eisenbacteria bacterium]|nr:SRPBCC family protein [Candidatus Eisenbacteria bacterium]